MDSADFYVNHAVLRGPGDHIRRVKALSISRECIRVDLSFDRLRGRGQRERAPDSAATDRKVGCTDIAYNMAMVAI